MSLAFGLNALSIRFGLLVFFLLAPLTSAFAEPGDKDEAAPPIRSLIRYTLPVAAANPGQSASSVEVTQAIVSASVNLGTAEQTAAALNGGVPVPLTEVIVVNGVEADAPTGVFALNAAAVTATGAALAPREMPVPDTVTAPQPQVPYLLAQVRVWKKGALDTGKNITSFPFQAVSLVRGLVAGGITYYGLIYSHHIPSELAIRATLLSATAAYGASTAISFLKLWYNSTVPWEGLIAPKSQLHLAAAALYKGIVFISFYSYLSLLAVEVAKPGGLPVTPLEWGQLVGGATVYVLSQLFWGVKFLNDQREHKTSDANLNLKMGVLAIVATAVLKYMAVSGPYSEVGYGVLMGSGALALFWKPIKSVFRRLTYGAPDDSTCDEMLAD